MERERSGHTEPEQPTDDSLIADKGTDTAIIQQLTQQATAIVDQGKGPTSNNKQGTIEQHERSPAAPQCSDNRIIEKQVGDLSLEYLNHAKLTKQELEDIQARYAANHANVGPSDGPDR